MSSVVGSNWLILMKWYFYLNQCSPQPECRIWSRKEKRNLFTNLQRLCGITKRLFSLVACIVWLAMLMLLINNSAVLCRPVTQTLFESVTTQIQCEVDGYARSIYFTSKTGIESFNLNSNTSFCRVKVIWLPIKNLMTLDNWCVRT